MKKRPDSELLQKKWRNNSSEKDFFSKHVELIHLAGLRVLKHFFWICSPLFISPLFHLLSSFSPVPSLVLLLLSSSLLSSLSILSCLESSPSSSSLFLFCLESSLHLSSSLFSPLSSSLSLSRLFLSRIVLSCLSFSVSLCLSLSLAASVFFLCLSLFMSVSVSVSLCLCLRVVCCGVCVVLWCVVMCGCVVWCPSVYVQNASVCRSKTSPCVPAPRAHVLPHAGVVPVHTGTFGIYARRRFSSVKHVIFDIFEHLKRMLGSSLIANFLLTMSGPYGLSRASEVHQRNP